MDKIDNVIVDGLVIMRIVKHCHEAGSSTSSSTLAYGLLFGLGSDDNRLEITNAFPLPKYGDALDGDPSSDGVELHDVNDIERSLGYMLRHVNIDHSSVGWYQCVNNGAFATAEFLSMYLRARKNLPESVCLVFDMAKLMRGNLSVKAYKLSDVGYDLALSSKFSPEAVMAAHVAHDNIFEEVPVIVRNSTLVNLLLLEMSESASHMSADILSTKALSSSVSAPEYTDGESRHKPKQQCLDLASAETLELQVKELIHTLDELNTEHVKYNRYQLASAKQLQEKTRYVQKRQMENSSRVTRGEDPLPEEDLNKIFKPLVAPERKSCLLLSSKLSQLAQSTERVCAQTISKWYVAEALYKGRASVVSAVSSST